MQVRSADGTVIAAHAGGSGPPLLLVHGATADHSTTWRLVGPVLERRYTVYRMDRRGRAGSGDADAYAMEREFEDVAAVVESIGEPVFALGHSYGAGVVLGALTMTSGIKKFIHYEGGIPAVFPTPVPVIDAIQRSVDAGDRQGALESLFRDLVGIDPEEFRAASGEEAWAARLRNVHTLPRELRAENDFDIASIENGLRASDTPVLLLLGAGSPPELQAPTERLAGILRNARTEKIPGEGHAAMIGSPGTFVDIATRFFDEA